MALAQVGKAPCLDGNARQNLATFCQTWEEPQVTRLMRLSFPTLHDANERNLRWKRHLFLCLGESLGRPGLRPPKCDDCGDFAVCMGAEAPATIRVVTTTTTRDEGSAASQGV